MEKRVDSLIVTFHSMVLQSNFKEAMKLISIISDKILPPSVVNDIVFNILMKNCEENIANNANVFLVHYLNILPIVKSESFQYDYSAVLHNANGEFQDTWCAFSHLVESSFIHHNISNENERSCNSEVVKYPNCDILIHFYVTMLTKFALLQNGLFEEESGKRLSILLEWINKIYKINAQILILGNLHKLLENKLKYEMISCNTSKKMHPLTSLILDKCPDIFSSEKNMSLFLVQSNLSQLNTQICYQKLYELIHEKKIKKTEHIPLTLKTIICNYFFKVIKEETLEPSITPKRSTKNTKKQLMKIFLMNEEEGNSELHKLCRQNKFGDVYEIVLYDSNVDINARNCIGRTPLHEACLSKSYYSASHLLEEKREQIDLKAGDKYGLTPLHCAAYMDSVEIVKLLLKHGGHQLVTLKDNFGENAIQYANSKSMKTLLESIESKLLGPTSDILPFHFDKDHFTVPALKKQEEYSIFLYGLHLILSNYLQNSNLYNYKKDNIEKLSHEQRKCSHYVSLTSTGTSVCDEDISIFKSLLQILDHFITSIQSYANEIGVDVRMSLIRLKTIRVMLNKKV